LKNHLIHQYIVTRGDKNMPAKTTAFDTALLQLIFNGTAITGIAQNSGAPVTNLYVSLHTSSPGVGGSQTTNEAAYSGYGRVAVVRSGSGWTVSSGSVSPVSTISFPIAGGGSETEQYFGIGTDSTGAGTLLYFGAISPSIAVSSGVVPQLTTSSSITES
jgi:hypothetical protein